MFHCCSLSAIHAILDSMSISRTLQSAILSVVMVFLYLLNKNVMITTQLTVMDVAHHVCKNLGIIAI